MYFIKKTAALLGAFFCVLFVYSQDFSNKGKDFWIGYGNHVRMFNSGGAEKMQLYITSDVSTTGVVEIASIGFSQSYTITANQITTVDIPRTAALMDHGLYNHGIHVTAIKPVVVYSFIYVNAVSGATVCLPTNTLGKEYYSVNYTQQSNENNSHSYFFVVAADTGTTTVEITPSALTKGGQPAGVPFNVNLTQGQVYQVLGNVTGNNGVDLTGSKIRSISTGTSGCKRIGVYSGSGKIKIGTGCAGNAASSDNLYQQMYPTATWGKKYITAPGIINSNNFFRIALSDPTAVVKLNGSTIPSASFVNGFYYDFLSGAPNVIESDKPILVAQYFTTQNCNGNPAPGDPDMIYLNPVEQTISNVTLNSMQPATGTAVNKHYINVILKNTPGAINSFFIDGSPYTAFTPVPGDPSYAYAQITATAGTHNLTCDTGFNVIAYGFGNAESYGYSGGTNLKDLYQFVSIKNQFATVDFPAACKNSPFIFSMTFPYQPTQIKWLFNGLFTDVVITNPVYDSTWNVNGKQLYLYKLPSPYSINTVGTFPIKVIAQNATIDGCSGEQEIDYEVEVFERPSAAFNFTTNGCVSDSVHFFDNSNANGRPIIRWNWSFGDGNNSIIKNPAHLYAAAGNFPVNFSVITDIGCLSDTVSQVVNLIEPPVAKFGFTPSCLGKPTIFTDSSTTSSSTIVKWYWNFGDGSPQVTATSNSPQSHTYINDGTFIATLKVETATGCQSIVFSKEVRVYRNLSASFTFSDACLPAGMQFTNTTPIGNAADLGLASCLWNFGDGNTSTDCNPLHVFNSIGPFNVQLTVTSDVGCTDDTTIVVNNVYAKPVAAFSSNNQEICLGTTINFTDGSSAANSTINQWEYIFGDGNTSIQQNPSHTYTTPGTYIIKLIVRTTAGCESDTATQTVIVNPLPDASFSNSSPTCENNKINFSDASTANAGNLIKWTWNMGDGSTFIKNNNNSFAHTYAATGTYNVTLQVETDKGCISTFFQKSVIVHPLPVPAFTVPGNCLSDPFSQFTDNSTIADGTESGFTYLWNFGDANATGSNPNTSTLKDPQHKYSAVGNYTVTLTVTSINGCSSTITQPLSINGVVPQSSFVVQAGNEHCSNSMVNITNNSAVDFGNVVKVEIFWDYTNDPTNKTIDNNPQPGEVYSKLYNEFFTPATRTANIRLVAYSGESCLSTSSQTITLKASPQLQFNTIASVCGNVTPFQIEVPAIINGLGGTGIFSGNGISSSGLFDPSIAGTGNHILRYTYNASNGCTNYAEQTVQVLPVPTVNAGPDKFLLEGGVVQLNGTGSGNNINFLWTPPTGLSDATIATPNVTVSDDQLYTLTVINAEGCSISDQTFVKVLKALAVPNAFSPNGDGIHDRWEIPHLESYPGVTVEVYNRYGQVIFKSIGYSKPWDGTMNGKPVPLGTYYYIINPKNGRKQQSGFVDIIR